MKEINDIMITKYLAASVFLLHQDFCLLSLKQFLPKATGLLPAFNPFRLPVAPELPFARTVWAGTGAAGY